MKALILSLVAALSVAGVPVQSTATSTAESNTVAPLGWCYYFPWFPGCPK